MPRCFPLQSLRKKSNGSVAMSHNQVIQPGPCLNHKITDALIHLRFDDKLLCYDLQKAFLQIQSRPEDSNKLLFYWFENVKERNFKVVAYRNLRLSFGLRCSPTILMLALYKILMLDASTDSPDLRLIKQSLYSLLYMDNGAFTGDSEDLQKLYKLLPGIFNPYGFTTQQIMTNDVDLQTKIDSETGAKTDNTVKLLGLDWNRASDSLSPRKISLNENADTKRKVLQTIASQYDTFNFQGPCLNRARLFLHSLQSSKNLSWDESFNSNLKHEWHKICKQANKTPPPEIPRMVGLRNDSYELVAFTDASKQIYAAVVYIRNLTNFSCSFLMAKNRLCNRQLELKTIPSLELQGITLEVEMLLDLKQSLSGPTCVVPINIAKLRLFTDSTISLFWLVAKTQTMAKMQKHSIFVQNRLDYVQQQCNKCPITFAHVNSGENPADCLSRCLSHSQLSKTCYYTAPKFLSKNDLAVFDPCVTVPNPDLNGVVQTAVAAVDLPDARTLVDPHRFSSFRKIVGTIRNVIKFVEKLKSKLAARRSISVAIPDDSSIRNRALNILISEDQRLNFPDIFKFFASKSNKICDIPSLVSKAKIFLDTDDGLLKVKSKFDRWRGEPSFCFPILLSSDSKLTHLIISDMHIKLSHSGCYSVLTSLRKQFFVPKFFSTTKKVLKQCITCKRFNQRPLKLTQNSYRHFRADPPSEPFRFIFIDHFGPFHVKLTNNKSKIWVLCITCLWSRAVSLIVCNDLSVRSFLRALQIHIFREGLPSLVMSDLGSQITAGTALVADYLDNAETKSYLAEHGIKSIKFQQYFKGNSSLGSLVEICVKFAKRLIYGSIKNNVLDYPDFTFLIEQTTHILNKRPVAFKDALRQDLEEVPSVITPELLCRGHELMSLNLIPSLQPVPDDPEFKNSSSSGDALGEQFSKLRKVRENLVAIYDAEFRQNLISQAVDKKDRYIPVTHNAVQVGDIILIRDPMMKASHYPMAIVRQVLVNDLGEVTGAIVKKGTTGELVKRHASAIIPLLRPKDSSQSLSPPDNVVPAAVAQRPVRRAALKGEEKIKNLVSSNLV